MDLEIEKAKEILKKKFCLMQWQQDDADKHGIPTLNGEDIRYLQSINLNMHPEEILSLDGTEDKFYGNTMKQYIPEFLHQTIVEAKDSNFKGICIIEQDVTNQEREKLEHLGYHVEYTWASSTKLCIVYFTEEDFIRHQIANFQDFFGSIKVLAEAKII